MTTNDVIKAIKKTALNEGSPPFWFFIACGNLTRLIFHKNIIPRMQIETLPHNSIAANNFYVILNTNQITLYTYPDLLKENNLNLKGYY